MDKSLKTALIIGGIVIGVIVILSIVPGLIWGWQGEGCGMKNPSLLLVSLLVLLSVGLSACAPYWGPGGGGGMMGPGGSGGMMGPGMMGGTTGYYSGVP